VLVSRTLSPAAPPRLPPTTTITQHVCLRLRPLHTPSYGRRDARRGSAREGDKGAAKEEEEERPHRQLFREGGTPAYAAAAQEARTLPTT
jgi:hypothetical protein